MKVPELWRFEKGKLQINLLQNGSYVVSEQSKYFPNFDLAEILPQYLEQSKTAGRNSIIKAFRNWVREQIQN